MEPLNNRHFGPAVLSFKVRLSSLWRSKYTSIIEKGPQNVSFIERLNSTGIIEKGYQSVSFIERCFLSCPYSECPLSEVLL